MKNKKYKYYVPAPPNEWTNALTIRVNSRGNKMQFLNKEKQWKHEENYWSHLKLDLIAKRIREVSKEELALYL